MTKSHKFANLEPEMRYKDLLRKRKKIMPEMALEYVFKKEKVVVKFKVQDTTKKCKVFFKKAYPL